LLLSPRRPSAKHKKGESKKRSDHQVVVLIIGGLRKCFPGGGDTYACSGQFLGYDSLRGAATCRKKGGGRRRRCGFGRLTRRGLENLRATYFLHTVKERVINEKSIALLEKRR